MSHETQIRAILTKYFGAGEWAGEFTPRFTPAAKEIAALFAHDRIDAAFPSGLSGCLIPSVDCDCPTCTEYQRWRGGEMVVGEPDRDSDRSGEAIETTQIGSTAGESAGRKASPKLHRRDHE